MKKQGNASRVISYIVLILIITLTCGMLAYFTNGFTSEFKTFYVSMGDKDILTQAGGYAVTKDSPLEIDVKYTFGVLNKEVSGYSVKVVPNLETEEDFTFTVDGEEHSFKQEADLTKGFDIAYEEKSFSIKPKGGLTEVLQAVYDGREISYCDSESKADMFTLIVTSYNGESNVKINFYIANKVSGVTLDKEVIVF